MKLLKTLFLLIICVSSATQAEAQAIDHRNLTGGQFHELCNRIDAINAPEGAARLGYCLGMSVGVALMAQSSTRMFDGSNRELPRQSKLCLPDKINAFETMHSINKFIESDERLRNVSFADAAFMALLASNRC